MKAGISGCLSFFNCRYDGNGFDEFDLEKAKSALKKEFKADTIEFIPVCPEQLGGLTSPRVPAEIIGGSGKDVWEGNARVMTRDGRDVTEQFKRGAQEALACARKFDIKVFILKEDSPSCGSQQIYTGRFDDSKKPGSGVTTALLEMNGIKVFSEDLINF